jgi:hypothetical protein
MDVEAFEIYLEWRLKSYTTYSGCPREAGTSRLVFSHLLRAYLFGIEVEDETFCGAVIEALTEIMIDNHVVPQNESVIEIYEQTPGPANSESLL